MSTTTIKKCSTCGQPGHNASNKKFHPLHDAIYVTRTVTAPPPAPPPPAEDWKVAAAAAAARAKAALQKLTDATAEVEAAQTAVTVTAAAVVAAEEKQVMEKASNNQWSGGGFQMGGGFQPLRTLNHVLCNLTPLNVSEQPMYGFLQYLAMTQPDKFVTMGANNSSALHTDFDGRRLYFSAYFNHGTTRINNTTFHVYGTWRHHRFAITEIAIKAKGSTLGQLIYSPPSPTPLSNQ